MNIKQLREFTGLSQKKFSEKFKIPVRTIQNWESGTNPAPVYTERLIEMQLILENEIEAMRAGQLQFSSKSEKQPQEEINTDTVTKKPKQEPEQNKILIKMKKSLMEIEIDDLYCENCVYGEECNFDYDNCEYYQGHYRACNCIENWIYWEDLERMIENGTN